MILVELAQTVHANPLLAIEAEELELLPMQRAVDRDRLLSHDAEL